MDIARRKERNGGGVKNVRVDSQVPFLIVAVTRGHAMVHWSAPKIMDQRSVLTKGKKNLFPSIHNRGK
jgi:hypothetical protein